MKYLFSIIILILLAVTVRAEVRTEVVEYKHGDTVLEGYLAYDDAIKGKRPGVLIVHEWMGVNSYVKKRAEQVAAFQDEMRKANVDWHMVIYGGAVHSFTNPDSGNDNSKGAAYNEKADKRSWEDMRQFFSEIFK